MDFKKENFLVQIHARKYIVTFHLFIYRIFTRPCIFNFYIGMTNFKWIYFLEGRNCCIAITNAIDCEHTTGEKISWRTVPVAVPQIEVAVSLETCVAPTCRACRPTYSAGCIYVDRPTAMEANLPLPLTYARHDYLKKSSYRPWNVLHRIFIFINSVFIIERENLVFEIFPKKIWEIIHYIINFSKF